MAWLPYGQMVLACPSVHRTHSLMPRAITLLLIMLSGLPTLQAPLS